MAGPREAGRAKGSLHPGAGQGSVRFDGAVRAGSHDRDLTPLPLDGRRAVTSAGRQSSEDGSFVRSAGGAIARGALLVAVAVLIGVLLLARGLDSGDLVASGRDDDGGEQTEGTSPGGTASSTTSTSAAAVRPPSEVRVLVANGSGVPGVAGQRSDALGAAGYVTLEPANAAPTPTTQVLFVEGFQSEASAVATALGFAPTAVQPLPDPPPVDPLDANVVVVLGQDTEAG